MASTEHSSDVGVIPAPMNVDIQFGPWPINRRTAMRLGAKHFFTDKTCGNGHLELRFVSGACMECVRVRMRRLTRESEHYREMERARGKRRMLDPDYRTQRIAVWNAHKVARRASSEEYRESDRESARQSHQRRQANDESYRERQALKAREWFERNRERARETDRVYYEAHKPEALLIQRARKARVRGAEGTFKPSDIAWILDRQDHRCIYCRADLTAGFHVDHILPLSRGGSNWPKNLQCLCPRCNMSKGSRTHEEFVVFLIKTGRRATVAV